MNLTRLDSAERPVAALKIPWWTRGDTNAFFGLGFNILVNVLTLTSLLIFVVQVPSADVLGTVLPALGIAMLVGNIYYTFLARRLARRENRTDVTALPYGPSVPHMFIVVFVIMLPIFLATKDPVQAWEAGLAWAFVIGVIVLIGAFVGPFIRKITPRAAMLGTLAGISLTFISMRPAAQIWEAAWIGLPVLGIILVGFFTNIRLPGGIPVGLAALLVGTAIGWIGGYMSVPDVKEAVSDIAVGLPTLHFDMLFNGLSDLAPLLATAIPLGVYNFAEAMSNVESAAAAGDSYNLRSVLLADGSGAIIGAALGSPFPPAVYIGHPGWKASGGRASYSMASGVLIALLCFLGLVRGTGHTPADPGDRADPALHRFAHRCAGLPVGAARPGRRGRRGDPAQPRLVGNRADGQRPRRRGYHRGQGRGIGIDRCRSGVQRAQDPRRGRGARRHGARIDRGLHPDASVLVLGDRGRRRCRAQLDRLDPRRRGGVGSPTRGGARIRDAGVVLCGFALHRRGADVLAAPIEEDVPAET